MENITIYIGKYTISVMDLQISWLYNTWLEIFYGGKNFCGWLRLEDFVAAARPLMIKLLMNRLLIIRFMMISDKNAES